MEIVLKRFNVQNCKLCDNRITNGENLSLNQSPKDKLKEKEIQKISCASAIGSLMYVKVYIVRI